MNFVCSVCFPRTNSDPAGEKHLRLPQESLQAIEHHIMAISTEQRVRSAALSRDTNETKIQLAMNLDGGEFPSDTDSKLVNGKEGHATQASKSQTIAINSGIGFLDHMLHALAKHAGWSLALNCKGDLHSRFLGHWTFFTRNRG